MNKPHFEHPGRFAPVGVRPAFGTESTCTRKDLWIALCSASGGMRKRRPRTADTVASCRYGHLIQQRSPATVAATLAAVMRCPPSDSCSGCVAPPQAALLSGHPPCVRTNTRSCLGAFCDDAKTFYQHARGCCVCSTCFACLMQDS